VRGLGPEYVALSRDDCSAREIARYDVLVRSISEKEMTSYDYFETFSKASNCDQTASGPPHIINNRVAGDSLFLARRV